MSIVDGNLKEAVIYIFNRYCPFILEKLWFSRKIRIDKDLNDGS